MDSPETVILKQLLNASNGFVSGNKLASELGVSRVAIWSHMEKLRADGFHLEARPRLGYRITRTPDRLNPLFLRALLPKTRLDLPIHFYKTVDSTNNEAERIIANGSETPFVVIAQTQENGRGRLGRRWVSSDSGNLYLSFAFKPLLSPRRMQTFTLWAGAAMCDFLNKQAHAPVLVKWPNDLVLNKKKIGGILTEARVDSDRIRDLVLGLGLNVNGQPEDLPAGLKDIATSIAAETGIDTCLNAFAAALIDRVLQAYEAFTNGSHQTEFRQVWEKYDLLRGQPVNASRGKNTLGGIARGIDDDGQLLLELPDGSIEPISGGDVTLRTSGLSALGEDQP